MLYIQLNCHCVKIHVESGLSDRSLILNKKLLSFWCYSLEEEETVCKKIEISAFEASQSDAGKCRTGDNTK